MANLTNKSGGWSAVRLELGAWEKPALLALLKDLYGIAGVTAILCLPALWLT